MTVSVGICRDACRLRCEWVQAPARDAANLKSFEFPNYKPGRGGTQGKRRRGGRKMRKGRGVFASSTTPSSLNWLFIGLNLLAVFRYIGFWRRLILPRF